MLMTPDESSDLIEYPSVVAMAGVLAERIANGLASAIADRSAASLAVSGGSTPRALYERLSRQPLDWSRVAVVLVDERWVEPGAHGSNETFVREIFSEGGAAAARWVGLKSEGETPSDGLGEARARLATIPRPFDAVVLGMGLDGHTASWFPHADGLAAAIDPEGPMVAAIEATPSDATGPFTRRITLTRSALSGAREIHLLLSGDEKRRAFEAAVGSGPVEDMPLRALLRDSDLEIQAHWAP